MGDLIDRQAAIDAVEFGITYAKAINKSTGEVKELFKEGNKSLNEAVERIKDLTSAQPVDKDTNVPVKDCISRQDAIDALFELYEYQRAIDPTEAADLVRQGIFLAEKKIEKLPSAQPDLPIKEKCAFCPHCNNCDVNDDLSIQPCMDTISRQAAIDEIKALYEWHDTVTEDRTIDHLKRLPSAQPTQCNSSNVLRHPQCANRTNLGNCDPVGGFCTSVPKEICDAQVHDVLNDTDIVSRQAAIDALKNERSDWNCDYNVPVDHCIDAIYSVPSAQPEPTAGDCWGCNCPKMNKEPKITFETLQSACKYRRVYSIKGRERKYVDCFYDDEVNECKNSNCPLMNQRDTEEL